MLRKIILPFFLLLLPISLLAHGSHGSGIMAGFTHPIFGLDHAIAILGTGILSYLIDKSKWYLYLGLFILAMIGGGIVGIDMEATEVIEKIIAVSVVIIGAFIGINNKINPMLFLIPLGIFGFFHGFAHGAEMPPDMSSSVYISGYSLGASLVGVIGMLISRFIRSKNAKERNIYFVSGVILGCGIMILLG